MNISSTDYLAPGALLKVCVAGAALYVTTFVVQAVYDAFFGPLSKYPGPKLRALSSVPEAISTFFGHEVENTTALHAKYGPVVRLRPRTLSYAHGAQAWKEIYGFRKPGQPVLAKDPVFYTKPMNRVDDLVTADGATHSRQRKILSHSFSDRALKDLEPMLKSWVAKLQEKFAARAATGAPTDMVKYYNFTTFDIMSDLSFNESLNMLEKEEYSQWVSSIFGGVRQAAKLRAFQSLNSVTTWLVEEVLLNLKSIRSKTWEHFNHSVERVDRRLQREPEQPDLWTKIIEKSKTAEQGLSLGEHHSNAALLMLAGTETTATALSGMTYFLLHNPSCMARLTTEIRSTFSSFDEITMDSLARLQVLNAVVHEGLRLYPPVPSGLPRVPPPGGAVLCGEYVPEGVSVSVHQMSTYRNPALFHKPLEFRPERWLGEGEEYKHDQLTALEPFSVGPRNCLGKNLAYHEMRMILAATLLHFDLELCPESHDWAQQLVYVLWEKTPLMCRLKLAKT